MGDPHPIAWYIESPQCAEPLINVTKAGRTFYTSLGHSNETWHNQTFQRHVYGGLAWTLNGASTRAFGVGVVGNSTPAPPQPPPTPSPSPSANPSAVNDNVQSGSPALPLTGLVYTAATAVVAIGLAILL